MVQEKYCVQLSTQEKGRLRRMMRSGRRQEFDLSHDQGAHPAQDG